jgi:exosome complex component RRP4
VDIILGLNGFVWVSSGTIEERREGGEGTCVCVNRADDQDIPAEGRKAIATVASILGIFAQHNIPITDGLINDAYAWVQGRGIGHGPLSSEEGDRLMLEVVDVDVSA